MGFEEADPHAVGVNDMPVACLLGRGRIHGQLTASRRDVGCCPSRRGYGIRKIKSNLPVANKAPHLRLPLMRELSAKLTEGETAAL